MILTVNTSSPELDHLAAALAETGLLSAYVRPYANLERKWEQRLAAMPGLGRAYARSFARRKMPSPLSPANVHEAALTLDFLIAAHALLPVSSSAYQGLRKSLSYALANAVGRAAASMLVHERAVVATWGCAEHVFRKAKAKGRLCVLNYPLAHHRFTRRYLLEEAQRQPAFANTLNGHDLPEWLERRFDAEIELADRVMVGSSFARLSFTSQGVPAEKLVVIPYGTDTELFEPAEKQRPLDQKLRLLFVGQIGQRKGISYLLEAMRHLHGLGHTLTVVGQIQGDGRTLARYQHLFRHVPQVGRTQLREIYRQADVFVFPTLVEGMPIVVLEAMASGLPVITTARGPGDIVRDGVEGFLVPPRDVEAIVKRLEKLSADADLRTEMSVNARQRALEFTWQVYRERTAELLGQWIGEPSRTVR